MLTEYQIQDLLNGPGRTYCVPMQANISVEACQAYQQRERAVTPCTGCVACTNQPKPPRNFVEMVKEHNWTVQKNKEIKAEKRKTLAERRKIANETSAHHRRQYANEVWQDLAEARGFKSERGMLLAWRLESNAEVARRVGIKFRETVRERFRRYPDIRRSE